MLTMVLCGVVLFPNNQLLPFFFSSLKKKIVQKIAVLFLSMMHTDFCFCIWLQILFPEQKEREL